MIWIGALGVVVGFVCGWYARWQEAKRLGVYPVQCGDCHEQKTLGAMRQLRVEIWGPPGLMLKQWNVGSLGEMRDTRQPGQWLLAAIAAEVRRIELLQMGRLVLPAPDTPPVALTLEEPASLRRLLETGEARGPDRRQP